MPKYQPHDRFYRKARSAGLPSRAAFKIEELIRRFDLLHPGARVVDLGCAPGGWIAILARAAGSNGRIVGVDLAACKCNLPNVTTIIGDIRESTVQAQTMRQLGGRADLVTSDLAPKLTGIAERDQTRSLELIQAALQFACYALKPKGGAVMKLFMGSEFANITALFRSHFGDVEIVRVKASRPGSAELYVVARNFLSTPISE
jgi:23S rRNA (uridine2552-2'-O)-methyltransferase